MDKENIISTVYSAGPNFRAYLAMGCAMIISMMLEKRQPKAELKSAVFMALPACPFLAIA